MMIPYVANPSLADLENELEAARKIRMEYQFLYSLRAEMNTLKAQAEADHAVAGARLRAFKEGRPLPSYYLAD